MSSSGVPGPSDVSNPMNFVVECVVKCGDEVKRFNAGSVGGCDLEKAKPVEVTTNHEGGPLKDLLGQLENVQVQTNHHLTQMLNNLKPQSEEQEEPEHKKQKTN